MFPLFGGSSVPTFCTLLAIICVLEKNNASVPRVIHSITPLSQPEDFYIKVDLNI